ncbi:hypothetical protein [Nocardioides donggukensis]|uniref:Copper chaperone PCu(A)C n=1 Tax=Nocardioides donggukensis TaxID=2774019 RepID=A0A927K1W1_9ACTN|nr:hypothetical protein [Nocardioides donggukensis]MBD8868369.1 hypothetical protein [Nocardioides donggukensis]
MLLRNRIARVSAAGTLLLATPLLAACGSFATDQVYTPGVGTNDRDSSVDVLGAVIVATEDGEGTFVTTLVNNETAEFVDGEFTDAGDRLLSVSAPGGGLTLELERPVPIDSAGLAKLADGDGIPVEGEAVVLGSFVELELTFANADPVRIEVPVVPNNGAFAGQDGTELTPTTAEEVEASGHSGGEEAEE